MPKGPEEGFAHARKIPRASIIRIVLRDDMPVWLQHLGVATLRIDGVDKGLAVVETLAFVENVHVVAVCRCIG